MFSGTYGNSSEKNVYWRVSHNIFYLQFELENFTFRLNLKFKIRVHSSTSSQKICTHKIGNRQSFFFFFIMENGKSLKSEETMNKIPCGKKYKCTLNTKSISYSL